MSCRSWDECREVRRGEEDAAVLNETVKVSLLRPDLDWDKLQFRSLEGQIYCTKR